MSRVADWRYRYAAIHLVWLPWLHGVRATPPSHKASSHCTMPRCTTGPETPNCQLPGPYRVEAGGRWWAWSPWQKQQLEQLGNSAQVGAHGPQFSPSGAVRWTPVPYSSYIWGSLLVYIVLLFGLFAGKLHCASYKAGVGNIWRWAGSGPRSLYPAHGASGFCLCAHWGWAASSCVRTATASPPSPSCSTGMASSQLGATCSWDAEVGAGGEQGEVAEAWMDPVCSCLAPEQLPIQLEALRAMQLGSRGWEKEQHSPASSCLALPLMCCQGHPAHVLNVKQSSLNQWLLVLCTGLYLDSPSPLQKAPSSFTFTVSSSFCKPWKHKGQHNNKSCSHWS